MTHGREIWQMAAGPKERSYADVFFRYGVGLIGPGYTGPWEEGRSDEDFEGPYVRWFASEIKIGDVVLLRQGAATIIAIGIVASNYMYLTQFDDVMGWDLQHARRIRWYKLPQEYSFATYVFGGQPRRLSRTWNQEVRDFAERFLNSPPTEWQEAPLPDLPEEEPLLTEIPPSIAEIVAQAQDLVKLFWDQEKFGDHPREDEMIAHLVIPFLRLLGWLPEQIAVKWRDIDVAVFKGLPRKPENCRFIIEAKRLGDPIESALPQAKGYVKSLKNSCDIIVTDGFRYRMYSHENGFAPVAYANLTWLKRSAIDLFERMKKP